MPGRRAKTISKRVLNSRIRSGYNAEESLYRYGQYSDDMSRPEFEKYARDFRVRYKSARPGTDPNKKYRKDEIISVPRKQKTNKSNKHVARKRKSCKK